MTDENKSIKGYKGFDKDLKCLGHQYKVGETYDMGGKPVLCSRGFHFCEEPFDVFSYYAPGEGNRFCEVVGDGKTADGGNDSKIAATRLKVGVEIGFKGIVDAGVKFILDRVSWKKGESLKGDKTGAQATGYRSAATNAGDRSAATNTGYRSAATNTGYRSAATNTGDRSAATNTGDQSAASVEGNDSIACGLGAENVAKGSMGCWLVLAEWELDSNYDWHIKSVKTTLVDGKKIKADTWYKLKNGRFVQQK